MSLKALCQLTKGIVESMTESDSTRDDAFEIEYTSQDVKFCLVNPTCPETKTRLASNVDAPETNAKLCEQ